MRQTSTPEAFITEFQRLAIKVTDISEQRLVMLFTEGLIEPLNGWVKHFRPPTLQYSIKKTQNMANTMVRKAPIKTFIPQKRQTTKFPQLTWTGKDGLDEDTWKELRRKKL